jgi:CheY-like chemotaxis protein
MSKESLLYLGSILLVDDDEEFRAEASSWLQKVNGKVVSLPSATHATKYTQSQKWDWLPGLIITDIVMGGMGGYEFIRRMVEAYPNKQIPIIVVSKLNGRLDILEAESAGALAYITKPVTEVVFINTLSKVLNRDKSKPFTFKTIAGTET